MPRLARGGQSGRSCPHTFSSSLAPSLPGFQQVNQGHLRRDPFGGGGGGERFHHTLGLAKKPYGLVKNICSQGKQQMRPSEGST